MKQNAAPFRSVVRRKMSGTYLWQLLSWLERLATTRSDGQGVHVLYLSRTAFLASRFAGCKMRESRSAKRSNGLYYPATR